MVLPITESVVDPGEGPGGTGSPLCLDQRGRKGRNFFFLVRPGPSLSQGLDSPLRINKTEVKVIEHSTERIFSDKILMLMSLWQEIGSCNCLFLTDFYPKKVT